MKPKQKQKPKLSGHRWITRSKYGNVRSGGFASKLEHAVYQNLKLQERAGIYTDVQCQVAVTMTRAQIRYVVDFSAVSIATGEIIYLEAKGHATDAYAIKKKLWEHYGPGRLEIWGGVWTRPYLVEVITVKGVHHENQ
jgi:hypothetical protein